MPSLGLFSSLELTLTTSDLCSGLGRRYRLLQSRNEHSSKLSLFRQFSHLPRKMKSHKFIRALCSEMPSITFQAETERPAIRWTGEIYRTKEGPEASFDLRIDRGCRAPPSSLLCPQSSHSCLKICEARPVAGAKHNHFAPTKCFCFIEILVCGIVSLCRSNIA
ncbi:MAG: hypothetical protein JWO41_771 [Candidatus Saccharibacteria bacterium]|nr:hypothetical protein [Candidatus Saccharibacteria bacterium]